MSAPHSLTSEQNFQTDTMTSPWKDVFNTPPAHLQLVWVRRIENRVAYQAQFLDAAHTRVARECGEVLANGIYTQAATSTELDTYTNDAAYWLWVDPTDPPTWCILDPQGDPRYQSQLNYGPSIWGATWLTINGTSPPGTVVRPVSGFRLSYYTYPTGWTITDTILPCMFATGGSRDRKHDRATPPAPMLASTVRKVGDGTSASIAASTAARSAIGIASQHRHPAPSTFA